MQLKENKVLFLSMESNLQYQPRIAQVSDTDAILDLLERNRWKWAPLRQRTLEQISQEINDFVVVYVGDILAGCMKLFPDQEGTREYLELGAFATEFESNKISRDTKWAVANILIEYALEQAENEGVSLLSVTANQKLVKLYEAQGLSNQTSRFFTRSVRKLDRNAQIYVKEIP